VWLPLLTAVSACLAILGKYRGPGPLVYLFKPLTTVLILLLALLASPPVTPAYQWLIVLGLLFSLAGDVFLMLPRDRFVAGLVSFLIAHLFYIAAFAQQADGTPALPGLLVFAVYSVLLLGMLLPRTGRLRLPVIAYAVVLSAMGWQAAAQWALHGDLRALLALAGATLFILSDSILALDRFVRPFAAAQALLLSSYYLAQWLIALSVQAG